jgi:Cu+-exporting ATPase
MGLATPTAIMVATGKAAESGFLVRGGEAVERAAHIDTVVFDKTGTLTRGRPTVTRVIPATSAAGAASTAGPDAEAQLLAFAAAAEVGSEHPLGAAIVAAARERGLNLPNSASFETVAGYGVHARVAGVPAVVGNARLMADHEVDLAELAATYADEAAAGRSVVYVSAGDRLMGLISVGDEVRPEAAQAVEHLTSRGAQVWLLSGDQLGVALSVARRTGISADHVIAEVLPADKKTQIERLQADGHRVAMVGDGINDAPALAQADVGISIGTGTDVAIEASDITLVGSDLRLVSAALDLSRRTVGVIRQNLFWAFAYNVVLIPVAMGVLYPFTGILLDPVLAAAAMALSSVTVIGNSLRLSRAHSNKPPLPSVPDEIDEGRIASQTARG